MSGFESLAAAYRNMMVNLQPRGRAWTRSPTSNLWALWDAFAQELARLHGRIENLMNEADPSTALELLADWERAAGLPDDCLPAGGTITERQRRVVSKITSIGGQSRAFFIELAAQLGIEIAIEEFAAYTVNNVVGLPINGPEWQYVWRVRILAESDSAAINLRSERFRSGRGRSGDRLRSFSVNELECIIRRAAPAHTRVLFAYPIEPEPILWFDFLSDNGQY